MTVSGEHVTLEQLAQEAIGKYLKQATRYEKAVLADTDPEDLHQMRVGMRRLRTALQVFAAGIYMPKAGQANRVGKVARVLGQLRDLDVTVEALQTAYLPGLPKAEQKALQEVFEALHQQRPQALKQVKRLLKGDLYKDLKTTLKAWVEQPVCGAIATLPATTAVPDLILPLVSNLWLHPGWFVGTQVHAGTVAVDTQLSSAAADALIAHHGDCLHSLRKQVKRVRYQLKLVSSLYGDALEPYLDQLETMQETLGQLQDSEVLSDLVESQVSDAADQLPAFFNRLQQNRHQAWQTWQGLQQTALSADTRDRLRLILARPGAEGATQPTQSPPQGNAVAPDGAAETPPEPSPPQTKPTQRRRRTRQTAPSRPSAESPAKKPANRRSPQSDAPDADAPELANNHHASQNTSP